MAYYDLTGDKAALDAACRELDCLISEVKQKKATDSRSGRDNLERASHQRGDRVGRAALPAHRIDKVSRFFRTHRRPMERARQAGPQRIAIGRRCLGRQVGEGHRLARRPTSKCTASSASARLYRATGDRKYLDAAVALAQNIRREELFITGTGSEDECWFHGRSQQTRRRHPPAETCVTAHWMYLCWQLLRLTGDPALCRRDGTEPRQRPAGRPDARRALVGLLQFR